MWLTSLLMFLLYAPLEAALSVAPPAPASIGLKQIEACAIQLRELKDASVNFGASRAFRVTVNQAGTVQSVAPVQDKSRNAATFDAFVFVDEITDCVRRWKFTGAADVNVSVSVNTDLEPWTIVLSSGSSTLALAMPQVDGPQWQYRPTALTGSRKSVSGVYSIEACRVDLTTVGRASSFAATAVYQVATDPTGAVSSFKPVNVPEGFDTLVKLKEFPECVQRWRFDGQLTATVSFSAGTKDDFSKAWKISVSSGVEALTVVLPRRSDR